MLAEAWQPGCSWDAATPFQRWTNSCCYTEKDNVDKICTSTNVDIEQWATLVCS